MMATNDNTKTAAYENYPNNPLTQRSAPIAIASGVTQTYPIECSGSEELSLEAMQTGTAAGDMVVSVFPVLSNGQQAAVALAPISFTGPTVGAPNVYYYARYDVSGQGRVAITVKNNNAAPANGTLDVKLS
jgi:hypothetical protein